LIDGRSVYALTRRQGLAVPVQATEYKGVAETPSAAESPDRESERTVRGEDADAQIARFQAVVRILDVMEPDAPSARRTVEERLLRAGFTRWRLVSLHPQDIPMPACRHPQRRARRPEVSYAGGGMLLVGTIVAWVLWLLWLLVD
jgi:hypothetical protein